MTALRIKETNNCLIDTSMPICQIIKVLLLNIFCEKSLSRAY